MTTSPASTQEFLALQQVVKGRYSLDRELGRGGMGVVFLARDVALDRPVAIKLLPPALATRADLRAAFLREARTSARLAHPHIVPIYAVEEHGNLVFFVMAFVDGETLGSRVRRRGPLAPGEAMRVTQEVAWALAHAHARGVIHRDVKPDNIMLERDTGRAIVTDFGIAHVIQSLDPAGGIPAGTPQYMSPEQARGEVVDGRSDLYSLGVTAYYASVGVLPFEAWSTHALLLKHAEEPAPHAGEAAPRLPALFADSIDRLLAKRPDDRPESAELLAATLVQARGTLRSVPAPVRRFLQSTESAAGEIATLATISTTVLIAMEAIKAIKGDFMGLTSMIEMVSMSTLIGIAGVRAAQIVGEARRLVTNGYQHNAVRIGAIHAERERELEQRQNHQPSTPLATWGRVGAGAIATALGFVLLAGDSTAFNIQFIGWIIGVTVPALTVRRLWRDLGASKPGGTWNRLLQGRLGRWLLNAASRTVRSSDESPSPEPTAVVLARAAEDLYHALPGEQRRQLAEVPAHLLRLQADVASLRALDDADPTKAPRIEAAVTALENIRLDLLKLHAGDAPIDDLTADLNKARRIGRRMDDMADAEADVTSLRGPRTWATPGAEPIPARRSARPDHPTPAP